MAASTSPTPAGRATTCRSPFRSRFSAARSGASSGSQPPRTRTGRTDSVTELRLARFAVLVGDEVGGALVGANLHRDARAIATDGDPAAGEVRRALVPGLEHV